jgi:hypothetical protein
MEQSMYVEAPLRDAILADAVWELWHAGVITDREAEQVWSRVAAEKKLTTEQ